MSQIDWARGDNPDDERPLVGFAPLDAFAGGTPQRLGWYRFYFADERWEWAPEHVAATLEEIRRAHKPFSTRHRIITVQGATRDVVVIGERLHNNVGELIGTQGFYIDVTPTAVERQASITEAVAEIADHRAPIEQAKGALMYVYRIDADAAFDLLKWRSQETNTRVRSLADQLLADVRTLKQDDDSPDRSMFDRLLLTTHQRVRAKSVEIGRG